MLQSPYHDSHLKSFVYAFPHDRLLAYTISDRQQQQRRLSSRKMVAALLLRSAIDERKLTHAHTRHDTRTQHTYGPYLCAYFRSLRLPTFRLSHHTHPGKRMPRGGSVAYPRNTTSPCSRTQLRLLKDSSNQLPMPRTRSGIAFPTSVRDKIRRRLPWSADFPLTYPLTFFSWHRWYFIGTSSSREEQEENIRIEILLETRLRGWTGIYA